MTGKNNYLFQKESFRPQKTNLISLYGVNKKCYSLRLNHGNVEDYHDSTLVKYYLIKVKSPMNVFTAPVMNSTSTL